MSSDDVEQLIASSGFIEMVPDEQTQTQMGDELVPSYESSQLQQMQRTSSFGSLHSRRETTGDVTRSVMSSKDLNEERRNLKRVGLQFLKSRQLFGLALGRDLSLVSIVRDLYKIMKQWYRVSYLEEQVSKNITSVRSSEFVMAAVWCVVSGYFTYQILDSLMVRWIIIYSPSLVIFRMVSMSMFIIMIIHSLTVVFNPDGNYYLHVWILISCALTGIYIIQSFVTSNLTIENYKLSSQELKKLRFIDLYNITVFAVVPIGVASFITMIGLIRNLLILKLDVESLIQSLS